MKDVGIVGLPQSGKTTLLEEILHRCGAVPRPGKVTDGSSFGDASPEARALAGTEGAGNPFWSPDSSTIAFDARGEIRRRV